MIVSHPNTVGYPLHCRTFDPLTRRVNRDASGPLDSNPGGYPRLPHVAAAAGIRYVWMKALGGYRKKSREDSPNIGLRNASFRNYADYMLTTEFENAMAELVALAEGSRTAYMCAERVYFHCHRMLVSDWLVAHGHEVMHIDGTGPVKPHSLTTEARMRDGELIYRGDRLL